MSGKKKIFAIDSNLTFPYPDTITNLELKPYDGVGVVLPYRGTTYDAAASTIAATEWNSRLVFKKEAISYADYQDARTYLTANPFVRFKWNFIVTAMIPGDVDWFERYIENVVGNYGVLARIANEFRFKGIWLDIEPYRAQIWKYSSFTNPRYRFQEYKSRVRYIGAAIAKEILANYPDCYLILPFGYHAAVDAGTPYETNSYGLLIDFLDGIYDAYSSGKLVIAPETTYGCKNGSCFTTGYNQAGNGSTYRGNSEFFMKRNFIGNSLMVNYQTPTFDTSVFTNNYFTPAELEASIVLAVNQSQFITWIYSDGPKLFAPSGGTAEHPLLPAAYNTAISNARTTLGL